MIPICLLSRLPEEYNVILDMTNRELPPKLAQQIKIIGEFVRQSTADGKDAYSYTIEIDPLTGEPRATSMSTFVDTSTPVKK